VAAEEPDDLKEGSRKGLLEAVSWAVACLTVARGNLGVGELQSVLYASVCGQPRTACRQQVRRWSAGDLASGTMTGMAPRTRTSNAGTAPPRGEVVTLRFDGRAPVRAGSPGGR